MRITHERAQLIREEVRRNIGADARVWLFGSRADDTRRGGDVDLHVETGAPSGARDWARKELYE